MHNAMAVTNNKAEPRKKGLNKLVDTILVHLALYELFPRQDLVEIMSRNFYEHTKG